MSTFETLAIVFAVYGVVFLAHRASAAIEPSPQREDDGDDRFATTGTDRAVGYTAYN